jgi:hypothetical protein
MPDVHGPFDTAAAVWPAARDLHSALRAADPTGALTAEARRARSEIRRQYIEDALAAARVELGEHDRAIVRSIAGAPVETLVVLLDWIARASAEGNVELLADAAEYLTPCVPTRAWRCAHGDWSTCRRTDVAWRLRGVDPEAARRHAAGARAED